MKSGIGGFIAIAAFAAAPAVAGPQAGDWEVMVQDTSGGVVSSDSSTALYLQARIGYFIDSRNEIGGLLGFQWVDHDVAGSDTNTDIGVLYRYNFVDPEDTSWFYGGVEFSDSSYGPSTRFLFPHAGWKTMLTEHVTFDATLGVSMPSEDAFDDVVSTRLGFTVIF